MFPEAVGELGGAIVEHRDDSRARLVRVVLPGELGFVIRHEVAVLAAQAPDHLAAAPLELVQRPRMTSRDEQVSVPRDLDRVEVQVVVAILEREVGVSDGDVLEASPLEQKPASPHVDLLDDPLEHGAVVWTADRREVRASGRRATREHGRPVRGQYKLMHIYGPAVGSADTGDLPVGGVHDHAFASAEAGEGDVLRPVEHEQVVQGRGR